MAKRTRAQQDAIREARKQRKAQQKGKKGHQTPKYVPEPSLLNKLAHVTPWTPTQKRVFDAYHDGKDLLLHGTAGTGKSFIACFLTIQEILDSDIFKRLVITRSAVPTRDQGALPGTLEEKQAVFESPYRPIFHELFGSPHAYDDLKRIRKVEFLSTSYLRGSTFHDCIVLCDEIQNMTASELNTVITRVGDNCKIVFAGDIRQPDLIKKHEKSGIRDFMEIIKRMQAFSVIEFGPEDIVRSRLVKEYILTRNELEDAGTITSLG